MGATVNGIRDAIFKYLDDMESGVGQLIKSLLGKDDSAFTSKTRQEIQRIMNIRVIFEPNGTITVEPSKNAPVKKIKQQRITNDYEGIVTVLRKKLNLTQQAFGKKVLGRSSYYIAQREKKKNLWSINDIDAMVDFFSKKIPSFNKDEFLAQIKL